MIGKKLEGIQKVGVNFFFWEAGVEFGGRGRSVSQWTSKHTTSDFGRVTIIPDKIDVRLLETLRSSRPEVFCKKSVLRNFTKFTGNYLCQGLFFNKVVGLRLEACNFIKKETLAQVFS